MKNFSPLKLSLWIIIAVFSATHLEAAEDIKFIEKVTSLGSNPHGYELVQNSLKYSPDFKHVSYVAYPDRKHMYIRLNDKTSPAYLAVRPGFPVFSANNRHAYIAYPSKEEAICAVDWQPGPGFENIDHFVFSHDGKHYAYRAQKNGKQCMVLDGVPGPFFTGIPIKNNMKFSPDANRFAYSALTDKGCVLVLDGKVLPNPYNFIQDVTFSPDSSHVAFKARIEHAAGGDKWQVIRDGNPGPVYNQVFDLAYSYDSKHFAYPAVKGKKMVLMVDGEELPEQNMYGYPVYSLNSKSFAYTFMNNGIYRLNINGKDDSAAFDVIFKFFYSLDSSRYAYIAAKDKQWYMVCDNEKSKVYKVVDGFKFSPDSTRFAYSAVTDDDLGLVVVDGDPQKTYKMVGEPYFSPDSKHVVYKAISSDKEMWATVIDEKMQNQFYATIGKYFFSDDSRHLAYSAMKKLDQIVVVVDGNEEYADQNFKIVGDPYFSPDGNHVAYYAMLKEGNWKLVVDGSILEASYAGFIKTTPVIYDTENHFHTIGIKDGSEFVLIEVDIPKNVKLESRFK